MGHTNSNAVHQVLHTNGYVFNYETHLSSEVRLNVLIWLYALKLWELQQVKCGVRLEYGHH
jgi:hypothetical protein